ncbi:hypothetical protein FHR71_005373 [Methylobacterium sp. RAS18]|nr:hypothetical protein [Methylobacterium sp. RAS18]
MGRRQADEQTAHLICELLVRLEIIGLVTNDSYTLPVTQVQLAEALGLTSVYVSRVLTELREQNLSAIKGKILNIPDVNGSKAFANFIQNYLHFEPKRCDGYFYNGPERPIQLPTQNL